MARHRQQLITEVHQALPELLIIRSSQSISPLASTTWGALKKALGCGQAINGHKLQAAWVPEAIWGQISCEIVIGLNLRQ